MEDELNVNDEEGTIAITDEGERIVKKFQKENPKMYFLIMTSIVTNFFDLLEEELDEKDFKRIKKSIEGGI